MHSFVEFYGSHTRLNELLETAMQREVRTLQPSMESIYTAARPSTPTSEMEGDQRRPTPKAPPARDPKSRCDPCK